MSEKLQVNEQKQSKDSADKVKRSLLGLAALGVALVTTGNQLKVMEQIQSDPQLLAQAKKNLQDLLDKQKKNGQGDYWGSYDVEEYFSAGNPADFYVQMKPDEYGPEKPRDKKSE